MNTQISVQSIWKMKQSGQKIAMLTAYDFPTARLLDESGVHMLLVGDSLGMVVQGQSTTLPVTMDEMIYHTRMVARATRHAMVIADLPFMSYRVTPEEALRNAGRLMQESGAHGVKLEGGAELAETVRRLVQSGIPVVGHLGLTPQSVHALGGFRVQGKTLSAARRMLDDALALQEAGAFALVLEMVPDEVATFITEQVSLATIGIGAGPHCDGQVLVFHDFIGFTSGYIPKHNKRYADMAQIVRAAAQSYVDEVGRGEFPATEQTIRLKTDELQELDPLFTDHLGVGLR